MKNQKKKSEESRKFQKGKAIKHVTFLFLIKCIHCESSGLSYQFRRYILDLVRDPPDLCCVGKIACGVLVRLEFIIHLNYRLIIN